MSVLLCGCLPAFTATGSGTSTGLGFGVTVLAGAVGTEAGVAGVERDFAAGAGVFTLVAPQAVAVNAISARLAAAQGPRAILTGRA